MNRSLEGEFLENLLRGPNDEIIDRLAMTCIVDLGIIESIDVNGRATVKTFRMAGDQAVVFSDIEVIGVGNLYGGITAYGGGGMCLLFAPKTCVPSLSTREMNVSSPPFSKDGIKALPITNCQGLNTQVQFTPDGTLVVQNEECIISLSKDLMTLTTEAGLTYTLSVGSDIAFTRRTESSGIYQYSLTDAGEIKSFINSAGSSKYVFQTLDDGSLSVVHQKIVPNQDPQVLNSINITAEGATTVVMPNEVSLSIDADGNISISTPGNVSLSTTGDNSQVSISTKSFNVNNGHLEVT